jgi:hypothetical protein
MKRAYAQHFSACAFVRRSPERRVSARVRRLCERVRTQEPPTAAHDRPGHSGNSHQARAERTDFTPQHEP